MRNISGIYTTNRKKTKRYSIQIAGDWNELTPGQFGTAIYMLQVTTKADPDWIRLSLLTLLFQKHWPVLEGVSPDDRHTLLIELTRFFYEVEPPLINFYPKIKISKTELISAALDLNNIGFGEWCFLDTYFSFYFKSSGDIKWLDRMIATVYRPRDPQANEDQVNYTGDLRQVFNENLIPKRAELVSTFTTQQKMAIFQWLAIALKQAKDIRPDAFPRVEPARDENGELLPVEQSEAKEESTWMDVFNELIGPKFGTPETLKHTNAFLVLDHLNKEQKVFKSLGK
jgi:hypothetical protein